MERDMDLVRKILLEVEKIPCTGGFYRLELEGYSDQQISYHLFLLAEAGMVEIVDGSSKSGIQALVKRLTWEGHEFLDAARDETRWRKLKGAMSKVGGFVLDVAKPILIGLMKDQVVDYLT